MPADLILSNDGIQCASGAIVDVKAAMPVSGTYTAGSIVLELTTSNRISGWKRLTTGSGHVLNTDWAYFNMPASPQSMVRVQSHAGYGSTNTQIRRYTNVLTNQGSDITYADSATLGATFTINTSGAYAISLSDSGTVEIGVSLNSAQLTTAIASITAADRLALATGAGVGQYPNAAITAYFASGAVIRPHGNAAAPTTAALCQFTIVRVA